MKVKSEDILKPGAKLIVEKIDFNDPEVKKLLDQTRRYQEAIKRAKNRPFKNVVITC
jgi:hypothetical protein